MDFFGKTHSRLAKAWFAALAGIIVCSDMTAAEIGCLPPTPQPCAADGVCRPNRETFGFSRTRWRRWPGDPQPKQPTVADELDVDEELKLEPFERPTPEQEDNRGPAKTKPAAAPEGTEEAEQPIEEDALPELPEENLFPEVDLQGSNLSIPQNDAPPALPPSLQRVAIAHRLAQATTRPKAQAHGSNNFTAKSGGANSGRLQQNQSSLAILQTASRQLNRMEQPSPTASRVGGDSQEAIFYEANPRSNRSTIE